MNFTLLVAVASGVLYYRIGQHEYGAGFTVAGLSVIVSVVTMLALGWGLVGSILAQVALFAALTVWNLYRRGGKSSA